MKRFVIVLALIALMSGNVLAEGITFGVKAGMIMANISDPPVLIDEDINWDTSTKMGMIGGVYMNYQVTGSFSIQPELLFAMKGFKTDFSEGGEAVDITAKFNYIEIPLLARFSVPVEGNFRPWFCVGPSIGFNMSNNVDGDYSYGDESESFEVDFDDVVKKNEFSLIFGGGFEYALETGAITFDIRYELGLTKIIESGEIVLSSGGGMEEVEDIEEQDAKNNAIVIMVGYTF